MKSIPGIGPVYAAGILAEIGSMCCFNSNNALAKCSGIIWRDNQFGEFDSADTPMLKAGNRYLRHSLIQAVSCVVRYCSKYTDYYSRKFSEVPKHQHNHAVDVLVIYITFFLGFYSFQATTFTHGNGAYAQNLITISTGFANNGVVKLIIPGR